MERALDDTQRVPNTRRIDFSQILNCSATDSSSALFLRDAL
jgi:hypothetical protein